MGREKLGWCGQGTVGRRGARVWKGWCEDGDARHQVGGRIQCTQLGARRLDSRLKWVSVDERKLMRDEGQAG